MKIRYQHFHISFWIYFTLLLLGQATRSTQLTPDRRFRFPWTPVHERSVLDAMESSSILLLEGLWKFWPDIRLDQAMKIIVDENLRPAPKSLNVPESSIGWGFDAEESGLFIRTFKIPRSWSDENVKIKCEGMFERAQIFINGNNVADHVGWTPFERDITDLVRFGGNNRIAVFITMEGYAPGLRYRIRKGGYPDLGGILRPIYIHAVPKVSVKDLFIVPHFNKKSGKWHLETQIVLDNSSDKNTEIILEGALVSASGMQKGMGWLEDRVEIPGRSWITRVYSGPVGPILPWNAETPNLYHMALSICNGDDCVIVAERFGFRTVEIEGEKLLLNGRPITLRGIAYKGGHADYGNASPYPILKNEVELMKQANINTVRLGWAFKSPDLHRACDEKGIYVISSIGGDQFQLEESLALQHYLEAFMCLKNSPSVLIWELQNENPRTPAPVYAKIMRLGRKIDPHRKFCHPGANYEGLDLICPHYLPRLFAEDKRDGRPFLPTEYAHVPSYELDKLKFDPGIHDLWGYSLKRGWDFIKANPWVIGCITFAWRDPYIRDCSGKIMPALHHESRWGVVDESFRIKPEYHHLFKVYAPVRVFTQTIVVKEGEASQIRIDNHFDFTNLDMLQTEWEVFGNEGSVKRGRLMLDIAPGRNQEIGIPFVPKNKGDYIFRISFRDLYDRLIQCVDIPYVWEIQENGAEKSKREGKFAVIEDEEFVTIEWDGGHYRFDKSAGSLRWVRIGAEELMMSGPDMNQRIAFPKAGYKLSRTTETLTRRVFPLELENFNVEWAADSVEVHIETVHRYSVGSMKTIYTIRPHAIMKVTCTVPPEAYGVSWRFPITARVRDDEMKAKNFIKRFSERMSWRRCGLWSWYPEEHLGRNVGICSFLNPHDSQNHSMKINSAFVAVGPMDERINMIIRDPLAKIHIKCCFWYNEFEVFVQGRPEDDYAYFDRTEPLEAMPHALSQDNRTYSFIIEFVDKEALQKIENKELNPHYVLVERARFWKRFIDPLLVDQKEGTVKGLPPSYPE